MPSLRSPAGSAKGGIVENGEILLDRAAGLIRRQAVFARRSLAAVGISLDQTAIHCKSFTADQSCRHAAAQDLVEQMAEHIALAKRPCRFLRKGRMVRHVSFETEPAEPRIGQVEMHLFAEPALRADAEAVAHEQHPDHRLRANRGPACLAVIGLQMRPDALEIGHLIDAAQ